MRPSPSAHRRNYTLGQIVPAEHIGLELGAEHVTPDVFQRTRLAVAALSNSASSLPSGREYIESGSA